ncbi:phage head-tail connector protein [Sphingomonas sp. HITSZ_GF]|uniref:phage head-tail connector protein n=1 Tax=Sphingomonas sp. HITSZ_GF TaxID=3037247 RepID=UPI00240D1CE7|nr:phage head-tail connector protein [Sphingomonas sp. HITSZ_GF]MDG2534483.1 phage head-tail connector protein [Sphingomonas sp. HITSZ_GF]
MEYPPFPGAVIEAARAAAKAHLRIAGDSEDALIEGLAASALALAERFTGTALIARDFTESVESKGHWRALTLAPVTAIDAGIDIAIDIDAQGLGWVRARGRATVGYRAGTAAGWGDLPPPIATGVVLLTAHLFDHREKDMAPPAAVSALWRPWRRVRLAA